MQVSYKFLQEIPVMDIEKICNLLDKKAKKYAKKNRRKFWSTEYGTKCEIF